MHQRQLPTEGICTTVACLPPIRGLEKCRVSNRKNTRGRGLWGKNQGSARVRSTSGEPRVVHHNPQVPSSSFSLVAWKAPFRQSQAERKVGFRTQEVQERNSEGLGMGRYAEI